MSGNFSFLKEKKEYALFAAAAIEAEKVYAAAPAMCAVGCRKALELAVKWVYAADTTMQMPYKDNLQSLIHEESFRFAMDAKTWAKLPFIVKLGNLAVHTERGITAPFALASLKALFELIQWIDYCYGTEYTERKFSADAIPQEHVEVDVKKIREQESLLGEREAEIEALRKKIEEMSAALTQAKEQHKETRVFSSEDPTEFLTRKVYIDVDMRLAGWTFDGTDVAEEYAVSDMAGIPGQAGFVDYVLFGRDGCPLAVVEAKRTSKDPNIGREQARLYADALERKFGRRPMMFTTNGFSTYFWDDLSGPQRAVSGIFSREDLQKLMNRRGERKALSEIPIDDTITDRYYQKEAIRRVCEAAEKGYRRHLLVMATGTGKTRTAASLADVLSRGGWVTNILFLADRTALVKQAKDDFRQYLPHMSLCNLCLNKEERSARIVFSTYPTMMNAIDAAKTEDGEKLFTPAHFDLIITDECHRSIFKKYRAIFDYFDAEVVGLTATPKTDVDRNTYDFFEMEPGVPTYAYDYMTAVETDHVLVPYYNYEVRTKFLEEGIKYDDLSEADKKRFEDDFIEDAGLPDFIPPEKLNKFVFNAGTVDIVLQDLMTRGIHTAGGDRLGKTIIFAQNKKHAEFILERFNRLYPEYHGIFAKRVVCDDTYAQTIIDDFKVADKPPFIAVSVDMMDTGIDVPECVNLVFFKKVRSKTKFWQMIGRGTRLCKGLDCVDAVDGEYTDKRRFLIFDYCGNFEYFREAQRGLETKETKTLSENIFGKKIRLAALLQESVYAPEDYGAWREEIVGECSEQIAALNTELFYVRLHLGAVEKFRRPDALQSISEGDKGELLKEIAPLVVLPDTDEMAKRFDNFMYGMMLACAEQMPSFAAAKTQLCGTAALLEKKKSIPQVAAKMQLIRDVQSDEFWETKDLLALERARKELRELIKFLDDKEGRKPIITILTDPVIGKTEGIPLPPETFESYEAKVNRYVNEHGNMTVIHKLTHNVPLTEKEYCELERILTEELGSPEDYARVYGDTPFGLLIRKIAKLDHEAVMQAFSEFISDESLNADQIAFVHKIISYIEANGYMESAAALQKAPFDRPYKFIKLFDERSRKAIIAAIDRVKANAELGSA